MLKLCCNNADDDNPQCNNGYCHNLTSVYRCHIDQTNIMNQVIPAIIIIIVIINNNNKNIVHRPCYPILIAIINICNNNHHKTFSRRTTVLRVERIASQWLDFSSASKILSTYYISLKIKGRVSLDFFSPLFWPVGQKNIGKVREGIHWNKLAKARKTQTSPGTLCLKKFGLGKLWVKKVFRKYTFKKYTFKKYTFRKYTFGKYTFGKYTFGK